MKVITISVEEFKKMLQETVRTEIRLIPRKRKKPYTGMEVDELFGISSPTRHAWAKKGYIVKVDVGGRTYYTADSVEQHFQGKGE